VAITSDPWAPYTPTPADPWDLGKVAHLHRRAGFGATRAELLRDLDAGPAAAADRLLRPPEPTADERQVLEGLRRGAVESRDMERLKAWWLYRVLYDPDPLREKLTLFWHSHFATSNRKVQDLGAMLRQNETLRKHALGGFGDLLNAVASDPAMLVWLDGAGSRKEKPNENFAREFFELFTLGLGNYAEADVREASRAFAGWKKAEGDDGGYAFDPERADPGAKTVLRQTGPWKAVDVVRITLAQPACAEFLCRKLYRFFVSEATAPDAALLRPLAEEFRKSGHSVAHAVGVILRSRHFYDRANRRQRLKGPVEHSAGLLRMLEVPRADVNLLALAVACERQGQDLFHPPNVKGWDGGKTWLTSTTVLERGNWGNDVVWGNLDLGLRPYDPAAWAARQGVAPQKAVDALTDVLLQDGASDKARAMIAEAGRDGRPDGLRKAVQRALHCAEFQLA
jgi:uncharacterized protein (DUF1800 family)